ncbi:hypothetical protein F5B20DRAFT_597721 [Whalleya microplaca]|nr:hypothetical protein F5B20DRAFT_597721 [Whalleya microplaca]
MAIFLVPELATEIFSNLDLESVIACYNTCKSFRDIINKSKRLEKKVQWHVMKATRPQVTNAAGQSLQVDWNVELNMKYSRIFYKADARELFSKRTAGINGDGNWILGMARDMYQDPANQHYKSMLISQPPMTRVIWISSYAGKETVVTLEFPGGLRFCQVWKIAVATGKSVRLYWPEKWTQIPGKERQRQLEGFGERYQGLLARADREETLVVAGNSTMIYDDENKLIGDTTRRAPNRGYPKHDVFDNERAVVDEFRRRGYVVGESTMRFPIPDVNQEGCDYDITGNPIMQNW